MSDGLPSLEVFRADRARYAHYVKASAQAPQPTPAKPRPMPEPSGVEAEGLKRVDALAKPGGLSFGDARSDVFAADPECYAQYAHRGTDLAPAPETAPTVPTLTPTLAEARQGSRRTKGRPEARCTICRQAVAMVDEVTLPRGALWGRYYRQSGDVWTPSARELRGLPEAMRAQVRALHARGVRHVRKAKRSRHQPAEAR